MILNERDCRHEQVVQIAQLMMTAARTAPKAKGVDIIEVALVTESNLRILSETMKQMYEDNGFKFFLRDADNILEAECVVLIGTREHPQGLNVENGKTEFLVRSIVWIWGLLLDQPARWLLIIG